MLLFRRRLDAAGRRVPALSRGTTAPVALATSGGPVRRRISLSLRRVDESGCRANLGWFTKAAIQVAVDIDVRAAG
jgi:hypothetical protein